MHTGALVLASPFSFPPSDRSEDQAVGEDPSAGIRAATPLAAREKKKNLQRESQREKPAHIKKK